MSNDPNAKPPGPESDPQWALENTPLALTKGQIERLEQRHGTEKAHELIARHADHALRKVRISPPHRGGR
jgi:hypothetical protein